MRLDKRVIIVTGGGLGIGKAYCERLASEGASIVVADIDGDAAESVAEQLRNAEGDANAVAPGLTLSLDEESDEMIEYHQTRAAQRAFKRLEKPDDLVGTVAFLCSPDSDFMTGQTLVVDGGLSLN